MKENQQIMELEEILKKAELHPISQAFPLKPIDDKNPGQPYLSKAYEKALELEHLGVDIDLYLERVYKCVGKKENYEAH